MLWLWRAPLGLAPALFLMTCIVPNAMSTPQDDYYTALKGYFTAESLIPITIPRGHAVGDVFDTRTKALIASRTDCFPKLGKPAIASFKAALPSLKVEGQINLGLAVAVPTLAAADAGGMRATASEIQFDSASVERVSAVQLQKTADLKACPFLAPIINGGLVPLAVANPDYIVVQEVIFARRKVRLNYATQGAAKAAAAGLGKVFAKLGLGIKVNLSGGQQNELLLEIAEVLPLAVRPAFIFTPNILLGGGDDVVPNGQWEEVDVTTHPSQTDNISELIDKALSAYLEK